MVTTKPARRDPARDLTAPRHQALGSLLGRVWAVDQVGVEERAASLAKRTTPFTPAVSLFLGLAVALTMLEEEGFDNAIARHAALGAAARAGVAALGLEIFPARPSNVLTTFRTPAGTDGDALRKDLERRFGIKIAGGQGRVKGQILRLGHLGYYDATDLFDTDDPAFEDEARRRQDIVFLALDLVSGRIDERRGAGPSPPGAGRRASTS